MNALKTVKTGAFSILHGKKHNAILYPAIRSRQFRAIHQRCILPDKGINAGALSILLGDFFPRRVFYKNDNTADLDILMYVRQDN
jgi:hypothetical protein